MFCLPNDGAEIGTQATGTLSRLVRISDVFDPWMQTVSDVAAMFTMRLFTIELARQLWWMEVFKW